MWKIIVGRIPDENDFWATMRSQILDSSCEFFNWFWATMCQIFGSLYEFFNGFLGNSDGDFLNILGMVEIALLTVMIPIAVTLLTGFAGEKRDFGALDRNVIFKYIVNAELFLYSIILVYVPILLWNVVSSYPIFRVFHLILWGCGVGIMMKGLINVSLWYRGHEFKFRYEYLKRLKNPREMKESWHSVWEVENIGGYNEKQFFTIFSSTIDKFLYGDTEKVQIAGGLIDDFNSFIDKRSVVFFTFSRILGWHFFAWQKESQLMDKEDKINEWASYSDLSRYVSIALGKMEEKALKTHPFSFLTAFKPHVEKYKEDFVEVNQDKKKYYLPMVMSVFFDTLVNFLEKIEYSENTWRYFPFEWKITLENIKNPENYVSRALCNEFIYWASKRMLSPEKYDKALNDVAGHLFPHACQSMWANILTFALRSYSTNYRMKSLMERGVNFGSSPIKFTTRVGGDEELEREAREDMERQRQAEEEETISLALHLFGGDFTQDNLKNYIAELKMEDDYKGDESIEYRKYKRDIYIDIFEKLLKARCKKDAEK